MNNDNILWWDCETTGLSTYNDRIISISFIFNGKGRTFLINPMIPIPEGASRVHGIYDSDVKDCPPFSHYAGSIMNILNMASAYGFYNGRNFDYPILYTEMLRCGYIVPQKPFIDVYEVCRELFKSLKLKDIYRVLLNKNFKSHDSMEDIRATVELHDHIIKNFLDDRS